MKAKCTGQLSLTLELEMTAYEAEVLKCVVLNSFICHETIQLDSGGVSEVREAISEALESALNETYPHPLT